ncbi:hypothetical protein BN2497_6725 [Janthinobacterium sp. CG23_2]|nr:hypothetical protein BN2497_6725 [Janthinobacterium sp. CG23_2]CUU29760.1 hypothetical protein BN3177_6725 [Janthinobacterium sp. CG23_2]
MRMAAAAHMKTASFEAVFLSHHWNADQKSTVKPAPIERCE